MIEYGWVFPDGTEDDCGLSIHEEPVKRFIKGLKSIDFELYKKIDNEIEDLFFKYGSNRLYSNYAIKRLGWIKVGYMPLHIIRYAGFDWQSDLVSQYEEQGYHLDNLYLSSSEFLPIKYNVLSTIKSAPYD